MAGTYALRAFGILSMATLSLADETDWVDPVYAIQSSDPDTMSAMQSIIRGADTLARTGPWTVTTTHGNLPPSKDPHDYLSWAPYHWPDCNWCSQSARKHYTRPDATPGNGTSEGSSGGSEETSPDHIYDLRPPDEDDPLEKADASNASASRRNIASSDALIGPQRHRMLRQKRQPLQVEDMTQEYGVVGDDGAPQTGLNLPTDGLGLSPTTTTPNVVGSPTHADAAAKSKQTCTPSPTTSMAPSATWTTCPYVTRDGKVNPDVRTLPGPDALNDMSQAVLYNALAYGFTESKAYAQNAAKFLSTFFVDPSTRMNPNMNFGQIVRGPGPKGATGSWTGILDMRGNVKTINAIDILRGSGAPGYTRDLNQGMMTWYSEFLQWMTTNSLGKTTLSKPNNHGTFYVAQEATMRMFLGDQTGAIKALQRFFGKQFLDQIAASGEQPFEAVRTRPYHYRSFNLEGLIVLAKIGDELGLDLWNAQTKYGSTIKTAIDYTMQLDPGDEGSDVMVPHVAAAMSVYGDPNGRYESFLKTAMSNYKSKPFWLYDQPDARPRNANTKRTVAFARDDLPFTAPVPIAFECPEIFFETAVVELDIGVFVTCEDLRPFYELKAIVGQ